MCDFGNSGEHDLRKWNSMSPRVVAIINQYMFYIHADRMAKSKAIAPIKRFPAKSNTIAMTPFKPGIKSRY
jgi:hypothetical protein